MLARTGRADVEALSLRPGRLRRVVRSRWRRRVRDRLLRGDRAGKAIVPGQPVGEQRVLELRAPATIVHDHRPARRGHHVRHNADVRLRASALGAALGLDIARLVLLHEVRNRNGGAVLGEEAAQRLDAAVVDAGVPGA
jgi:hypothetical protein